MNHGKKERGLSCARGHLILALEVPRRAIFCRQGAHCKLVGSGRANSQDRGNSFGRTSCLNRLHRIRKLGTNTAQATR